MQAIRECHSAHSLLGVLFFHCLLAFFLVSASEANPEARALLAFKAKADSGNRLSFPSPFPAAAFPSHCLWQGITCDTQTRVTRVVIESVPLGGVFAADTLSRLDHLRLLSLQNDSLTGPIPDLSGLANLKTVFLDHNSFTGSVPPLLSFLHRLRTLDLSHNHLTGPIPVSLATIGRLYYLRLDSNRFDGPVPPFNQSSLYNFNVSGNNLTGAVPVTSALRRFSESSFLSNPGLCGEIVRRECKPLRSFFGTYPAATASSTPPPRGRNAGVDGVRMARPLANRHRRDTAIVGLTLGVIVLVFSVACFALAVRKQRIGCRGDSKAVAVLAGGETASTVMRMEVDKELEEKVKRAQGVAEVAKSGSLVFSAGEVQAYTVEELMRASAELLGRGTVGATYKAVLDSRVIVCVKRIDACKMAGTGRDVFESHMESVGALRHPNLVPLRAYFQAKQERLLVYDYQPNGSLFSLIHGSKSSRGKPLHWTSCLKIAEDVAQGLSYIHQAWRLDHGNLKSSNILLGSDFEACLSDYCLAVLVDNDAGCESAPHMAPEIRKFGLATATSKSDVYSFGVLLLELLTGKPPSEHPKLSTGNMIKWVRSEREGCSGAGDDSRMGMLLDVAVSCCASLPEQRPTMWRVMKMIQEIKEAVLMLEDLELLEDTSTVSGVS